MRKYRVRQEGGAFHVGMFLCTIVLLSSVYQEIAEKVPDSRFGIPAILTNRFTPCKESPW